MPRRNGKLEDAIWFRADNGGLYLPGVCCSNHNPNPPPPAFQGHIAGCYENEDGHVVVDLTVADGNVFFWWPPDESLTPTQPGKVSKRDQLNSQTTRWILDPKAKTNTRITPAFVWNINGEFSRIDDRWVTKRYT